MESTASSSDAEAPPRPYQLVSDVLKKGGHIPTDAAESRPNAGKKGQPPAGPVRLGLLDDEDEEKHEDPETTSTSSGSNNNKPYATKPPAAVTSPTKKSSKDKKKAGSGAKSARKKSAERHSRRSPSRSRSRSRSRRRAKTRSQSRSRRRDYDSYRRRSPSRSASRSGRSRYYERYDRDYDRHSRRDDYDEYDRRARPAEKSKSQSGRRDKYVDEPRRDKAEKAPKKPAKKASKVAEKLTRVDKPKPAGSPAPSTPAVVETRTPSSQVDGVAEVLHGLRLQGRSMTLGPGSDMGLRMEQFAVAASLEMWTKATPARVDPKPSDIVVPADNEWGIKRVTTDNAFCDAESWLRHFDVIRAGNPSAISPPLYSVPLDGLQMVEQVAVLQSALWEAGFSFENLVPRFLRGSPVFKNVAPHTVQAAVFNGLWHLAEELYVWDTVRFTHVPPAPAPPPPPAPSRVVVDPNARREPESLISSSTGSRRRSSVHDSSDDEGMAGTQRVPVLERDTFFRQPGLGVRAGAEYRPYSGQASARLPVASSIHRPPPPAFDAAMSERTTRARPAQEPARPVAAHTWSPPPLAQPYQVPAVNSGFSRTQVPVLSAYDEARRPEAEQAPPEPAMFGYATPTSYLQPSTPSQAQVMRPYVPHRQIDLFYGNESLTDRRGWWDEYQYVAHAGGWDDMERWHNLRMYLRGSAFSWYKQLKARLGSEGRRPHWKEISGAFFKEFCVARESRSEKYFLMSQSDRETPRQYLWRLNAAAYEAGFSLSTPEGVARHVVRFIRSLKDLSVHPVLVGRTFAKIGDVEEALLAYEDQVGKPDTRRARSSGRSREHDRDRSRERERPAHDVRERSKSVAQAYYTYEDDVYENEYSRPTSPVGRTVREVRFEDDEYFEESDSEANPVFRVTEQGRGREGQKQWKPSQSPASQTQNRPPYGSRPSQPRDNSPARRRDRDACFECGGTGHWSSECPARPVCAACQIPGHTADVCRKKCYACGQVHARPEDCVKVKALEDLKAWVKADGNTGCSVPLPASVLQHLN